VNLSQEVLAILMGIECASVVSDCINNVSIILEQDFVPLHLGLQQNEDGTYIHLNRTEAIDKHSRQNFNLLSGLEAESLAIIADGTYLFIDKPEDFDLQKETWSMQKKRNLVKPMILCLSSDYVLHCPGPFLANRKNNDASILNALLRPGTPLHEYLRPGDLAIVDRGFRDSRKVLHDLRLQTAMPTLAKPGQTKLSTKESNDSLIVTMTRFVIECVNGRLKKK